MNRDELRKKLRDKIDQQTNMRTGSTLNSAKGLLSKNQSTKLSREVRKKGVKALLKHLNIEGDREIEELVAKMISGGEVQNPDELLKKIEEYKTRRNLQREAEKMKEAGPPDQLRNMDLDEIANPNLPSAKIKDRKPLRPPTNLL